MTNKQPTYTLELSQITLKDVARVGGKNASLGQLFNELKPKGVNVLDGFATTADAYRRLLTEHHLEYKLRAALSDFDPEDVKELAIRGHSARAAVLETPLPDELRTAILAAYDRLCERLGRESELAVRSSATAEDLPEASFAGQQETFLNVRGRAARPLWFWRGGACLYSTGACAWGRGLCLHTRPREASGAGP